MNNLIFYTILLLMITVFGYTLLAANFIFIELRSTIPFNNQWDGKFSKKSLLALKSQTQNRQSIEKINKIILYNSISKWSVYIGFLLLVILLLS